MHVLPISVFPTCIGYGPRQVGNLRSMTRMNRMRLTVAMTVARWLRVPVDVHGSFLSMEETS
jgi:hypothetical protein